MNQNPLNDDIPSNSHKSREQAAQAASDKPAVPVFEGQVVGAKRKKTGLFRAWLKRMFLSDKKPSEILLDIVENQIVPGIKDNFRNSLVSSVDMFIYPNTRSSSGSSSNNISYSNVYRSSASNTASAKPAPSPKPQQQSVNLNEGFTNPCFRFREERVMPDGTREKGAEDFLRMMKEYDYPTLSVHTLYMMRKMHIDYTWDAYGWTREEIANVKVVRINNPDYPWMIDLPQAHLI